MAKESQSSSQYDGSVAEAHFIDWYLTTWIFGWERGKSYDYSFFHLETGYVEGRGET